MKAEARQHLLRLCGLTLGMFAFGFALVPLYNALCDAIGLNGKVNMEAVASTPTPVDESRLVTVEFVTTVNGGKPWTFAPEMPSMRVHPGAFNTVKFYMQNTQDVAVVAQAIPHVAPTRAAKYLRKADCFCFNNQPFAAGEEKHMPVVFTLDPDLPKDVDTVTLSYTFFDVTATASAVVQQPKS